MSSTQHFFNKKQKHNDCQQNSPLNKKVFCVLPYARSLSAMFAQPPPPQIPLIMTWQILPAGSNKILVTSWKLDGNTALL